VEEVQLKSKSKTKYILVILIVVGFISTFTSGYLLSKLLSSERNATTGITNTNIKGIPLPPNETPVPTSARMPEIPQDSTKFLPGAHYFDDTIMIVTKDTPRINLISSVTRIEQEAGDFAQSSRASYFDGTKWTRTTASNKAPDSAIVSNNLVNNWATTIDPSRVLKQTAQGKITINNTPIFFSTGDLKNEISMRSLPGYTKFISYGLGTLTVNGVTHNAYIAYTRIYSLNASDIQFYNEPFGLTTDYIAFWDSEDNFYHIDKTSVDKPTTKYQTHEIGVFEEKDGAVSKSFTVEIDRDSQIPPTKYTASILGSINAKLNFTRINEVNKAPNGPYKWYLGGIEGTVTNSVGEILNGVGIVEYIHN
jgi:hypothetical protein